ncbi:MAG: hypothetical protein KDI19_03140, partial [Pseudomonadales bacterium]|nr:hypothetical protein [Pseudomonadales bacterium]
FTYSPAMDIQVSSNFERYLYYKLGEDTTKVGSFMKSFLATGEERVHYNTTRFDETFCADSASNDETLATIRELYESEGYLADPHTAVGIAVGKRFRRDDVPLLCLATAHPAKFDQAIGEAVPGLAVHHPLLDALEGMPTRKSVLDADIETVKRFIESRGMPG